MADCCRIEREHEGDRTIIRLSGTFDRASAHELTERLQQEPGDDLVLDFSLVREFADLGVAALAHGLAGADRRLLLRGLRQHQLRIFRYFGVNVEPLHTPSDADPLGPAPARP
jgi:anti-anti-sigma regulatory factor